MVDESRQEINDSTNEDERLNWNFEVFRQHLTEEQLKEIDSVLQSDPSTYGFKLWDGPSLSAYINNRYHVSLSVRQCQRLFHELGYSLIRPQPYPSKGYEDTEDRNTFKKNDPK